MGGAALRRKGAEVEDLQTLVRWRLDNLRNRRNRRTFTARDAALRAAKAGLNVTEPRLSQIAATPPGERCAVTLDTVWAIAVALDLHPSRVADAALRSTGKQVPVRRYSRKGGATTVSGIRAAYRTRSEGFDELTLVLPPLDLTKEEISELADDVDQFVTHLLERRAHSGQSSDSVEA